MQQPPNPYSQQTNPYAPPPPQMAPLPPSRPNAARRFTNWYRQQTRLMQIAVAIALIGGAILVGSAVVTGAIQGVQQGLATPTVAVQASQVGQPTAAPTTAQPTPTATPAPAYPPKTKADLQALAAMGDANAIHAFHSESVGLTGVCPQPKVEVTVDPSITGQKLIEDLLAYFYSNHYDNPCGALVLAYHSQAEANGDSGYTAGRVTLNTSDQSGGINTDPNATGLKYTLILDAGDVATGKEYTVTYNQ